jgi:hypothetical protein
VYVYASGSETAPPLAAGEGGGLPFYIQPRYPSGEIQAGTRGCPGPITQGMGCWCWVEFLACGQEGTIYQRWGGRPPHSV